MKFTKIAAPAFAAAALAFGASAVAQSGPEIVSFYGVEAGPPVNMFCVTANPEAVGLPCIILADGNPVTSFPLLPGPNFVLAPYMGPTTEWTATGPGILGKSILQEGLGIN